MSDCLNDFLSLLFYCFLSRDRDLERDSLVFLDFFFFLTSEDEDDEDLRLLVL